MPNTTGILPQAVRGTVCPTGYSSSQIPVAGSGPPPWLADWLRLPMQPLLHLSDIPANEKASAAILLRHIGSGTPLEFLYHGGNSPGKSRRVTPVLLFRKIDDRPILTEQPYPFDPTRIPVEPTYLLAHCHLRKQSRTFRLDRTVLPSSSKTEV